MENKNKASQYTSTIVITFLSATLILFGISYNSLRNENNELREEIICLERDLYDDQDDVYALVDKVFKLEEAVFKTGFVKGK